MDEFLNVLSSLTGLDQQGVLLLLGVAVAIANLVGKLIPDDATGFAALIRKVAKVLGLYVSNRKSAYDDTVGQRVRSPATVGILAVALALLSLTIAGCTPFSVSLARAAAAGVCGGAAASQAELDKMVQTQKIAEAAKFLQDLQLYCPSVFMALDLQAAKVADVPMAPLPSQQ